VLPLAEDSPLAIYKVEINPATLQLKIEMTLEGSFVRSGMKLTVPSWVAGDYDFEPYGRDLFAVKAKDPATGAEINVRRDGWNGYVLEECSGKVVISYTASAYDTDHGDAMGLVDSDYAVLMGTRYLFCPDYLGACRVSYSGLRTSWEIHHPSGANRVGVQNCWEYPSYEILLDTPVVMGNLTILTREIRDIPFYFVFVDQTVGFAEMIDAFLEKLVLTVKETFDIFGLFPFSDYTFVLSTNPQADWGLEHLSSNMSGLGPDVFVDPEKFAQGVRVCAHELFHAWNVRRLRPAPLGQLAKNLTCGCFTEGLWMAEGFTRYYEFLISTRAGAYAPDKFFSAVLGYHRHLSQQPAYERVTATDSSLATFLNHAKYPGRVNSSIDYYDKGMLIAFALDAHLRQGQTSKTLDSVFRDFYVAFFGTGDTVLPDYVGYTTQDVITFFNTVETGLGDMVGGWVDKPAGLDTPKVLARLGLTPVCEDMRYLGLFFMGDGAPTIYGVADTMPAAVGLASGDVITAVNGYAYTQAALKWAAAGPSEVILTVTRGHRILNFTMTPAKGQKITGLIWDGTPAQAALIARWVKADFAPSKGTVLPTTFYENFHGIEAMI